MAFFTERTGIRTFHRRNSTGNNLVQARCNCRTVGTLAVNLQAITFFLLGSGDIYIMCMHACNGFASALQDAGRTIYKAELRKLDFVLEISGSVYVHVFGRYKTPRRPRSSER